MVQREKSRDSLLFLMALAPCLCFSQTSNKGVVYVKPGTVLSTVYSFENKQGAELVNDGELYVYNDFKNDGKVGFTNGLTSGMTRFHGQKVTAQVLSGMGSSEAYNVEFNNLPGFEISNGLTVFGKADFQNGVVGSGGFLSFEKDAIAENADNASYVAGSVVKKGNKVFSYPVGDGGKYRPVSISAPSEAGAAFAGEYVFKNPNALYPVANLEPSLSLINAAEYWKIKRTDSGTSNVFVTLKWDEATTPSAIFTDPVEDIHVVRWDDVKQLWIDEGGAVDLSKKEVVTVSQSLGNYGVFTLARVKTDTNSGEKIVTITPGISPNGDGVNDELIIQGLDAHPNNRLTVFDRLGKVVFDTTSYNTRGNVFKGFLSENSNTILPLGTYFYTVDYLDEATGRRVKKSNYLYINLR
jgi:gliding motility-associated-like protein